MKKQKIDIFDINISYEMVLDQVYEGKQSIHKIILHRIPRLIYSLFKRYPRLKKNEKVEVLFFGSSINNQRAIGAVIENMNITNYKYIRDNRDYPIIKSLYISLPYFINLIRDFNSANSIQKKALRKNPLDYLLAYGKYQIAEKIISSYKPSVLVMANDHSPMNRCLLKAANYNKIKTLYFQHASVSEKFPNLNFDYALLDGEESFNKYRRIIKKGGKVLLVGGTRYDEYYSIPEYKGKKKLGIAVNELDNFGVVKKLCEDLLETSKFDIIIRPHPSLGSNWNKEWFLKRNIEYSDAMLVSPFEYLSKLNLQISNISGIHLDAAILNVPSIQYQLSKKAVYDQYGYVTQGLVKNANTYSELLELAGNPKKLLPEKKIVQYFVASCHSLIEGKVGVFIAKYISSILISKAEEEKVEKEFQIKVYRGQ